MRIEPGGGTPLEVGALILAMEFGPRRGTPLAERVAAAYPTAAASEIHDAIGVAQAVEGRAYELTDIGRVPAKPSAGPVREWLRQRRDEAQLRQARSRASATLRTEFPHLPADVVEHAVGQALYWQMRD